MAAHSAANDIGGGYYLASLAAMKIDISSIDYDDEMVASVNKLRSRPVWDGVIISGLNRSRHDDFISIFCSDPKWSFWSDWYERMWEGTFEDWAWLLKSFKFLMTYGRATTQLKRLRLRLNG